MNDASPHMLNVPTTQSQRLIWIGQKMRPDSPHYNMVWTFEFTGRLDPDRFAVAFNAAAQANEAMRLVFHEEDGRLYQSVAAARHLAPVWDLGREADGLAQARAFIAEDAKVPFDLSQENFRTRLIKISEERWIWYFNQHHIATDATSGQILWSQIVAEYSGTPYPPQPGFIDYAQNEAVREAAGELTPARDVWIERVGGLTRSNKIYQREKDPNQTASHRVKLNMSQEQLTRLGDLAGTSPYRSFSPDLSRFGLISAIFSGYLSRVRGNNQVCIGAPAHNRRTTTDRATMGLYVEMQPLLVSMNEADDLPKTVKNMQAEIMAWNRHAVPGSVTSVGMAATHAALNYMPMQYAPFPGMDVTIDWVHPGAHDSGQDLRLHFYDFDGSGAPQVELDAKAELFSPQQAKDAADQFLCFLEAWLQAPDLPLSDVPLITADHLCAARAKGADRAEPPMVLSRILARMHEQKDAVAIACEGRDISYGALEKRSDEIAAALQQAGVSAGQPVVLFCKRSSDYVAATLAAWKAGAAFVPVPRETTSERLGKIIGQLGQPVVLFDGELPDICASKATVLNLSQISGGTPQPVGPSDAAYILFTSGSTGTPKGVRVSHNAFARYIDWAVDTYGPQGAKSYALCTSIGFDLTLTSTFAPLVSGGTINIYPEPENGSDLAVLEAFDADQSDVIKLTPSHLHLALTNRATTSRLHTLILGGENLTTEICRRAKASLGPQITLANEYGPTEATVGCMYHRYDPETDKGASVPVGGPADDVELIVADPSGHPVPKGVVGELLIGGPRLADGYLNENETKEKFETTPAGRFYSTGDLAFVDEMGVFHYLGRSDEQIKLSGVRIELAEIEAALLKLDGVTEACVTLFDPVANKDTRHCLKCGLEGANPDAHIGEDGVCQICKDYEEIKNKADVYFKTPDELRHLVGSLADKRQGKFDAIMLLSGGKDSAYALYRLADLTRDILVLTLDNGFISEGAKENIRRMTNDLGLEHRFLTTGAMNAIFKDSLNRFSNVCQGCFKTIYALAMQVALDEKIPAIVTGLSRGQFFETRLTPELFADGEKDNSEIDNIILDARKAYHNIDDAVSRELRTQSFIDDTSFQKVAFIDIYRYIDVSVTEIYAFLGQNAPWIRPGDTGRSTNCLINDTGIFFHKRREGYHNYGLPYSWDVRLGHKTRSEAMKELEDDIDEARVAQTLHKIGIDEPVTPKNNPALVAYVCSELEQDEDALIKALGNRLPKGSVPKQIEFMDKLPLSANGKVDRGALPLPTLRTRKSRDGIKADKPDTELERLLAEVFAKTLGLSDVSVTENFYDMGGDSIGAIQIAIVASENGLAMEPNAVFQHQTIRELANALSKMQASSSQKDADSFDEDFEFDLDDVAAVKAQLSGAKS